MPTNKRTTKVKSSKEKKKLKVTTKKVPITKKLKLKTKKGTVSKVVRNIKKPKRPIKTDEEFLSSLEPLSLRKTERYMNKRQRTHFFKILESWKELLQSEQDRTALNIQSNPTNFPDQSDRASQEEEFTVELRTRERERKLLYKIEKSLNELSKLDYGYCSSCGTEIGIRRLEARPTATRCIDCKTLEEIKERQNFG